MLFMKKFLALLLAVLMILSLAACGKDADDSGNNNAGNNNAPGDYCSE